ncbi:TPA: hypothetical protein QFV83_001044 [Klebsiella aerogenes]|nr:hypothetical protein [Klebsiella aerogenes]
MRNAGVPEKCRKKALKKAYEYFDCLGWEWLILKGYFVRGLGKITLLLLKK